MDIKDKEAGAVQSFFWFKGKTELIETLIGKLPSEKPLKILDIGAGTGTDLAVIKKSGQVSAIDIEISALNLIPENDVAEKKIGDAQKIPYADGSFDVVLAFDVLEHIENDALAVQEIKRVLKQNGFFIFTLPAFKFLFGSHDKALNHYRRYNRAQILGLLEGLEKIKLGYWMFFLFLPVAAVKLLGKKNSVPRPHSFKIPELINAIFYRLLKFENWLIEKGIKLPFGVTIFGIFKKMRT